MIHCAFYMLLPDYSTNNSRATTVNLDLFHAEGKVSNATNKEVTDDHVNGGFRKGITNRRVR